MRYSQPPQNAGKRLTFACIATATTLLGPTVQASEPPATQMLAPRGIVRAVHQAAISTDLQSRVLAIHVKEGEAFKRGDRIVEFDCRRQQATIEAADANAREMQLNLEKFQMLSRMQSVGKNDLEVAEARHAKAKAEANALRAQLVGCEVIAPFSGRVVELTINRFEFPQTGRPFIVVASSDELEVDILMPSSAAEWLTVGHAFAFHVDELNKVFTMDVVRMGAAVDPISQTIKVSARFQMNAAGVLPGMSGTADLAAPERIK